MNMVTAAMEPPPRSVSTPVSLLKWFFLRKGQMLTCEIIVNGARYDVCVLLHWDAASSVIESYDNPEAALDRHRELAHYLRDDGWMRASEAMDGWTAAA